MKKLFLILMLAVLAVALVSCSEPPVIEPPLPEKQILSDGESVTIFGGSVDNNFDIIYPASDLALAGEVAGKLYNVFLNTGLATPALSSDKDKAESILELLVGDTTRPLSAEAKAIVDANVAEDPNGKHWIWLYKNGQLALYASSSASYELALAELDEKYFKDGVYKVASNLNSIGHVEGPHDAYMSYEIPDNFFDGYTDPFGMKKKDYKRMTVTLVGPKTYRISYVDEFNGTFSADFVQKEWGVWMMGAMTYVDTNRNTHNMTSSSTDYEFVLRVNGKGATGLKSGNHGNYPKDDTWTPYKDPETGEEDPTSYYNDRMLDVTFYDAKSGEKIEIAEVGQSVTVDGLRIVEHHNVYEFGYKQENVLINAERSYLYNGYDVMCDTKLYMTQDVSFAGSYSAMLPISKQYGNCAMFYLDDGSTVYMKTPMSNTVNETRMGVKSTKIDLWGENNPAYHITVTLNNPEDQHKSSTDKNGYSGFREMQGGSSNKLYCSLFTNKGTMAWGEELHFNTTWSFSIQDDFKNPDREPDFWVGVPK